MNTQSTFSIIHVVTFSVQLATCVNQIIKHDFPGRWTQIVDKISIYFQNPDFNGWSGALICLYQLVKNYEYKKADERTPLNEAMHMLLPMLYQLMVNLMNDPSEPSVLLQKQILKIYHALTQVRFLVFFFILCHITHTIKPHVIYSLQSIVCRLT